MFDFSDKALTFATSVRQCFAPRDRGRMLGGLLVVALLAVSVIPASAANKTWTVNFKDSDIHEVIKFVADATGKTLVVDPQVKGRVKVISATPLDSEQLYNLFLSVLEIHGFTAINVGDIVRVIPIKEARTTPAPIADGDVGDQGSDAQITQVIQLHNIAAVKVLPVIRPLVPSHAHLAAYAPSNAIIISDTAANIQRVRGLIDRIDRAAVDTTEMVPLEYAQAEEAVRILSELTDAAADKGAGSQLKLVADKRTNGILVSGDDLQRQRIKQLIARIDQPQQQSGNVRVVYLEYARAEQVAKVLGNVVKNMAKLSPGDKGSAGQTTIEADEDTNALLITSDPVTLKSLLAVIDRLDIRRAQVLVEAIIVEMEDITGRDLGVQWLFRKDNRGFGSSVNPGGNSALAGLAAGAITGGEDADESFFEALAANVGQSFGVGKVTGNTDFVVLVNALHQDTGANILSTPNLLTLDNNPAYITVGQNVPFVTGSYSTVGGDNSPNNPFQTVSRENVGITLEVTPHINEGDSVVLDITQEVSSLSGNTSASDVITNERKINTQVLARDGEVVVLGGLIKDDVQAFEQKVPVLGSIPVLGRLFRSESNRVTKTNLMVFIRATVIRDGEKLTGATGEKYRYIRDQQLQRRDLGLGWDQSGNPLLPEWQGAETPVVGAEVGLSEQDTPEGGDSRD